MRVPLQRAQTLNSLTAGKSGNLIVTGQNVQGGFICKLDAVGNVVFYYANYLFKHLLADAIQRVADYTAGPGDSDGSIQLPLPLLPFPVPPPELMIMRSSRLIA